MRLDFNQLQVPPHAVVAGLNSSAPTALSRVSRQRKTEPGHGKPSIHAGVPACPGCPGEKTNDLQVIEGKAELLSRLEQFQFDLVEAEIAAGAPAAELDRTNNLAWEFMQADALPFEQAMAIAASIVVACEPAPGEQEYTDVRSLWHELTGNQQATSTNGRKS